MRETSGYTSDMTLKFIQEFTAVTHCFLVMSQGYRMQVVMSTIFRWLSCLIDSKSNEANQFSADNLD